MALQPGTIISGRYRVDAFVGRGGMAEVYRVFDLDRSVSLALKVLHDDLAEDRIFLRRFKREAQTLATLQHPNIVRFYGLDQDGKTVYMVMDFIDGVTLRNKIFEMNRPFESDEVLTVLRPVCAALSYAHKQGFVHCDVKPANVMVDRQGKVYLSDFGIAQISEGSTSTMVGAGTPAYMAPEQILGKDPIPQTDIYALGIILYELLTGGERPFTGEHARTTGSTAEKVRWEQLHKVPPPIRQFNPAVSTQLEMVVTRCLSKDPTERYLSTTDLVVAVEECLSQPLAMETAIPKKERKVQPPPEVPVVRITPPAALTPTPVQPSQTPPAIAEPKQTAKVKPGWIIFGSLAASLVLHLLWVTLFNAQDSTRLVEWFSLALSDYFTLLFGFLIVGIAIHKSDMVKLHGGKILGASIVVPLIMVLVGFLFRNSISTIVYIFFRVLVYLAWWFFISQLEKPKSPSFQPKSLLLCVLPFIFAEIIVRVSVYLEIINVFIILLCAGICLGWLLLFKKEIYSKPS